MADHLCVTLNPVVDTTFYIDDFLAQYRTEAARVTHVAGGKGNNVGRVLTHLGESARVFNPLGGVTGRQQAELLAQDGFDVVTAWVSGDTRLAVTIMNDRGEQRAYFAPAAAWCDLDLQPVCAQYERALDGVQTVCLCGSSPNSLADEFFFTFLTQAKQRGCFTLLDSYGAGLASGLKAAPHIVKMNLKEAGDYLGRELIDMSARRAALVDLATLSGAEWVVITLGAEGAMLIAEGKIWLANPPKIVVVNPIGSGDSMTAGMLARYRQGGSPLDCLRLGMAAAAANVQTPDAGDVDLKVVEQLEMEITIDRLN